jgi:hypothetical protein
MKKVKKVGISLVVAVMLLGAQKVHAFPGWTRSVAVNATGTSWERQYSENSNRERLEYRFENRAVLANRVRARSLRTNGRHAPAIMIGSGLNNIGSIASQNNWSTWHNVNISSNATVHFQFTQQP